MWKTEVFGARPFRLALAFALAISAATISGFGLIYLEVSREDSSGSGPFSPKRRASTTTPPRIGCARPWRRGRRRDIRRIDYLALFDSRGTLVLGNIARLPPIAIDGRPHFLSAGAAAALGSGSASAVFVAGRRTDGGVTLLGRNLQDTQDIERTLLRALAIALVPTVAAILAIGAWFARRALRRLDGVHDAITRIMEGDLGSRLPVSRERDEIDRIARAVNLMLDEIARLLDQLKSVGDNIAHELRAPLTVAKVKLERALEIEPNRRANPTRGRLRATRPRRRHDLGAVAHFRRGERPARQAFPRRRYRRGLRAGCRVL